MTENHSHSKDGHSSGSGHGHVILSDKFIFTIGAMLLFLTVVTVAVAQVDMGWLNFPVAMLVATIKGTLVALFFMGLKYDKKENSVIMVGSLLFLAIFLCLTFTDLFFRPKDAYERPTFVTAPSKSKFKKPWTSQPELLAKGQTLFVAQCVSCHGDKGHGDGVASASLNPKPRNFAVADGWKNGRKVSNIFMTLTKGLNAMPSFGSLPSDDRWSLAHYVVSIGPGVEVDTLEELKKVGVVDPSKDDGGMGGADAVLPIDLAIELIAEDGKKLN